MTAGASDKSIGVRPANFAFNKDRQETDEEKARRIVSAGLRLLGWERQELPARSKSDQGKVAMAQRLRSETTMSLKWIAEQLHMGSWTYVSNLIRRKDHQRV